jgi:hypothetical protein
LNHKKEALDLVFYNLCLADGWLEMVTADIVELDSVVVEVVEDGQAELVALTIVGLWNSTTERFL